MLSTKVDMLHIKALGLRVVSSSFNPKLWTADSSFSKDSTTLLYALFACAFVATVYFTNRHLDYDDGLPIINRSFALEPRVFSRIRWSTRSKQILKEANQKVTFICTCCIGKVDTDHSQFEGRPYRLARGDVDMVVLPPAFIPELNKLPQSTISSRRSHASSILGHLNGMNVVLETDHHVKILLNRITPALPQLFTPISSRVTQTLTSLFPQCTTAWKPIKPLEKIVLCISRGMAVATFGPPACDDMELVETLKDHTRNGKFLLALQSVTALTVRKVFSVTFALRLVPWCLQSILVWLHPDKWRLRRTWKTMRRFVYPQVALRQSERQSGQKLALDLISCMVEGAKHTRDSDPELITGIVGSTAAGATYSSAGLIAGVIADLVAHPHFLDEIRQEIKAKSKEVNGFWNANTFESLEKLDSAMKETVRLVPGALVVYSRMIMSDHTLSNGLQLAKGQFVCVSGHARAIDAEVFERPEEYDALRAYNLDLQDHRARPFNSVLADDFRWGAGRWACPGRYIATLMAKIILVKLLDEYEFKFVEGRRPTKSLLHEFVFFHPETELLIRRRDSNSGIEY